MALYQYQGFSQDGKRVRGTIDAPSVADARKLLSQQNIYASKIFLAEGAAEQAWWQRIFARSIGTKEKLFFTKQLGVLLSAGVPLLKALELLIEQTDGSLKSVVIRLRDQIKEGSSLADAMAHYPKIFERVYVQLIRAGEASGKLEAILNRLYEYLERRSELAKKIRSALQGPLIQLGLIFAIAAGMMVFVVPQIVQVLEKLDVQLPLPTKILMGIASIFKNYMFFIIIALGLFYALFRYWKSTPGGARTIDALKLKLPLVKYFAKMSTVVQFSRTLGMLVEGGVSLPESLTIVTNLVNNRILADAIEQAKEKIIKQGKISQFLAQTGIFPSLAVYLINTGEQSGELDSMLLTVANHYEMELSDLSDSLTAKLQPLMLLIMALVVGFIIMSIIMPVMEITNKFSY